MVFWVTAFLDFPADEFDSEVGFWSDVTGYAVSPSRGDNEEFATLMPHDGDAFLRVQRLADGPSRIHLDLHVDDLSTAAQRAVELGAEVVGHPDPGHVVVLTSPGGFTFCFVREPAAVRPLPAVWAGDSWSIFDQVCLDIPADQLRNRVRLLVRPHGLGAASVSGGGGVRLRRPAARDPDPDPVAAAGRSRRPSPGASRPGLLRPSHRDRSARRARCGAGPRARTVDGAAQPRRIGVLPHRSKPEDRVARLNLGSWLELVETN